MSRFPGRVGEFIDLSHPPCPPDTGCPACRDTGMQVAAVHSFLARVEIPVPVLRSECLTLALDYLAGALPAAPHDDDATIAAFRRRVVVEAGR